MKPVAAAPNCVPESIAERTGLVLEEIAGPLDPKVLADVDDPDLVPNAGGGLLGVALVFFWLVGFVALAVQIPGWLRA